MHRPTVETVEGPAVDGCVVELDRSAVGRDVRARVGDYVAIELEYAAVGGLHQTQVRDAAREVQEQSLATGIGADNACTVVYKRQTSAVADNASALNQIVEVRQGHTTGGLLHVNVTGAGFGERYRSATLQGGAGGQVQECVIGSGRERCDAVVGNDSARRRDCVIAGVVGRRYRDGSN